MLLLSVRAYGMYSRRDSIRVAAVVEAGTTTMTMSA